MAGRIGRRVVQFVNLPFKLLMPSFFTNITEIALKTIPSASKVNFPVIKNQTPLPISYSLYLNLPLLDQLRLKSRRYWVQTLNMEGKMKKRGGILLAKPDYKKAFVTLKNPLSISPDFFPIKVIEEDKKELNKQKKTTFVEENQSKKSHWLEGDGFKPERSQPLRHCRDETARFPWTSMRSTARSHKQGVRQKIVP